MTCIQYIGKQSPHAINVTAENVSQTVFAETGLAVSLSNPIADAILAKEPALWKSVSVDQNDDGGK